MIFSNRDVARYLDEQFECAWQELRPVPQVWIDFGQGTKLRRTLHGNIATWFCSAKGEALDVVPGLVDAREFLRRARAAHELWQGFAKLRDGGRLVASYHRALARLPRVESAAVEKQIERAARRFDVSKGVVEHGLKAALASSLRAHATSSGGRTESGLQKDTEFNKTRRYPKAHAILAKAVLASPAALTPRLFKEVLGVDLADPFLGLAPYVLGGEGGRHSR